MKKLATKVSAFALVSVGASLLAAPSIAGFRKCVPLGDGFETSTDTCAYTSTVAGGQRTFTTTGTCYSRRHTGGYICVENRGQTTLCAEFPNKSVPVENRDGACLFRFSYVIGGVQYGITQPSYSMIDNGSTVSSYPVDCVKGDWYQSTVYVSIQDCGPK